MIGEYRTVTEYDLFSEIMEQTRNASSYEDPNMGILYAVGCTVWGWRQEYIKELTGYYIPAKTIESMKTALTGYREHTVAGDHKEEALAQIAKAEAWIDIALSKRVRLPQPKGKPRVF